VSSGIFPPAGATVVPFGNAFDHFAVSAGDAEHIVEHAAIAQIRANLETEVLRQQTIWAPRDQSFASAMGFPYRPLIIERVALSNYFVGARPSLVMASIDFWPSITSRCTGSRPSAEQYDQLDVYDAMLSIEILCKAGPVAKEELAEQAGIDAQGVANQQIQRLSAAAHMCIRKDPTLGGIVQTIQRPPTSQKGMPSAAPGVDRERTGDYYIYHGKVMRYIVTVNSY
jgi:hypothetical protein